MATYRFHTLLASLHIEDTPVGYAAAIGPDVRVRVAYNQREANQPSTMDFTNFGPQFVSNWVAYLIDNPSSPSADINLRKRGGGSEVHGSFNATTQAFGLERKTASVLYRLTANTYKSVPSAHVHDCGTGAGYRGPGELSGGGKRTFCGIRTMSPMPRDFPPLCLTLYELSIGSVVWTATSSGR